MEKLLNHDLSALVQTANNNITMETPLENEEIYLLTSFLSSQECEAFITETEHLGFGDTDYCRQYRSNKRLQP